MSRLRTGTVGCRTLMLLLLCLLATSKAHGTQLTVTLSSSLRQIVLYEGLPITVKLTNTGDVPQTIAYNLFQGGNQSTVDVRRPDGSTLVIEHAAPQGDILCPPPRKTLQPGESDNVDLLLSCDFEANLGSVFIRSGQYEIKVHVRDGAVVADSTPLSVTVVNPPESEASALKLVKALKYPNAFYEPNYLIGFHEDEIISKLEAIAAIKESKIYANYARYVLAWRHVRFAEMSWQIPKEYDLDKEVAAAEALLAAIDTTGFTLADKVEQLRKELQAVKDVRKEKGAPKKPANDPGRQ